MSGQDVHGEKYYRGWRPADYFRGLRPDTTATAYHKMVGVINREPHRTNKIMRQFYISALDNAKDSIKILNPYMTLTHSVKKAIKRALARGVKMDVMIAEKSARHSLKHIFCRYAHMVGGAAGYKSMAMSGLRLPYRYQK